MRFSSFLMVMSARKKNWYWQTSESPGSGASGNGVVPASLRSPLGGKSNSARSWLQATLTKASGTSVVANNTSLGDGQPGTTGIVVSLSLAPCDLVSSRMERKFEAWRGRTLTQHRHGAARTVAYFPCVVHSEFGRVEQAVQT